MVQRRNPRALLLAMRFSLLLIAVQFARLLKFSSQFGGTPNDNNLGETFKLGSLPTESAPVISNNRSRHDNIESPPLVLSSQVTLGEDTETSHNAVAQKANRPHFIMHVGPQKTGSTSLQCRMRRYTQRGALVSGTAYQFVGKIDRTSCTGNNRGVQGGPVLVGFDTLCAREVFARRAASDIQNVTCWKNYVEFMQQSHRNNQSIVVSEEKFSEFQVKEWNEESPEMADFAWRELSKSLEHWKVDVVIVYRRFYSWLASLKNQGDKYILGRPRMKVWRGPETEPLLPHLMRWMTDKSSAPPSPFVDEIVKEYRDRRGFNVILLNMHDGTDLLDTFFCQVMLPQNSNQVCLLHRRLERTDPQKQRVFNPSINPFYDIVVHQAKKRGILLAQIGRPDAAEAARKYQEKTLGLTPFDFPLICPSDEQLQPLLDKTLEYERDLLPDFFQSPLGETKLRTEFWADVRSKKFCTVDVDKVLASPTWLSFFARLGNSTLQEQ